MSGWLFHLKISRHQQLCVAFLILPVQNVKAGRRRICIRVDISSIFQQETNRLCVSTPHSKVQRGLTLCISTVQYLPGHCGEEQGYHLGGTEATGKMQTHCFPFQLHAQEVILSRHPLQQNTGQQVLHAASASRADCKFQRQPLGVFLGVWLCCYECVSVNGDHRHSFHQVL